MNRTLLSSEPLDIQMYISIVNSSSTEKYTDFEVYGDVTAYVNGLWTGSNLHKRKEYKFFKDGNVLSEHTIYTVRSKHIEIVVCRYFKFNHVNKLLSILKCHKRIN